MPRAHRPDAAHLSRQGVRDEILHRLSSRPGAASASTRPDHQFQLEAAARTRGSCGARAQADGALSYQVADRADFLRDMPPMSAGKKFWRSLEEYQQSDAFGEMLKAEFPTIFELWTVDRREVLRVMGASLALAGMSGCKPVRSDDVVPFVNRPEGYLEGRTDRYATAVLFDGYAQPVLATTSAGRPIKLDGNPEHPAFRGGSTPFMQAAILDLYDPDRSQAPVAAGHPASWADFDGQLARRRT